MTSPLNEKLTEHCKEVVNRMAHGVLVPFLGPGVTLLNRSSDVPFVAGKSLPYTEELSMSIADRVGYPWEEDRKNLLRVSWYGSRARPEALYAHLHDVFSAVDSTKAHKFFADIPGKLDEKGYRDRRQLIITTNYDRTLDEAFDLKGEPYDLLTYVANSTDKREIGKFRYKAFGCSSEIIDDPSTFHLPIKENILDHTIILKMQGAIDWIDSEKSSFAVSDEDYIDYLARLNTPAYRIPVLLKEKMHDSSFLFLGFGVSEWNLRVVLRSIGIRPRKKFVHESWAIMDPIHLWDPEYWKQYEGVEFMQVPLNDYIGALEEELNNLPRSGATP